MKQSINRLLLTEDSAIGIQTSKIRCHTFCADSCKPTMGIYNFWTEQILPVLSVLTEASYRQT
ncbi:hypothetical protein, partial [Paraburkholderia sp. GAS82]|uniref:hypothetical protein n=1 Tax=Paraburkholderia sp. GAS82 TaxID=3035137 RepID=UPI003D2009B0